MASFLYVLLILGDMNASLQQRKGNNQDTLLKDFQTSNNLHCLQKGAETFFHPNKSDKAEIDYILFDEHSKQIVTTVAVDSNPPPLNTSDHRPIFGTLSLKLTSRTGDKQAARIICKPKWDRCDKDYYRKSIRENLLPFDSFQLSTNSSIDILEPLSHLNAVLKQATFDSIPKFKSELTVKKIKNRPWSKKIHEAVKACHLAWWEWRKAGEPTDNDDPTVEQRRVTKQNGSCERSRGRRQLS